MLDMGPELIAALRIEAQRRFVQENNFRRVQETSRDFEAPLHPPENFFTWVVAPIPEFEELEQSSVRSWRGLRGTW